MKKLIRCFFIAGVVILFSACQKEISDPAEDLINNNNNNADFKVKKYREDYTSASGNFSQTFLLTYDADNRLISLVDSADATTKQVYSYSTASKYTMEFFNSGALIIHEDVFLNSVPLMDSTSQYNDTGDTTLEKYIYDAANHVTQIEDFDYTSAGGAVLYGTTDYTYDADGNITQETDNGSGTVYTYQYYTDLNTINVGKPYETKNKHLTKKTTIDDGSTVSTIDATYTYDSSNRVITQKEQYSTGEVVLKTYTY